MKMKVKTRVWSMVLALVVTLGLFPCAAFAAGGTLSGSGTPEDPYKIEDYKDLETFAQIANDATNGNPAACAILTKDITAEGNWTPIGSTKNKYNGSFDGKGHIIRDLTVLITNQGEVSGLFGWVGKDGSISNVGLEDGHITGTHNTGSLAGMNDGIVTNCYHTGSVTGGSQIGGVVGVNQGTVTNCYNTGTVKTFTNGNSFQNTGGVIGQNQGAVTGCYNTGTVTGDNVVGGVAGTNDGTITSCFNTGNVTGRNTVGGIVGSNSGSYRQAVIRNCYNIGDVLANDYDAGGVAGTNCELVENCFNIGNISLGDPNGTFGGVIGSNQSVGQKKGEVKNACFDKTKSPNTTEAIGEDEGISENVQGLTTEEMTGNNGDAYKDWKCFACFWEKTDGFPKLIINPSHKMKKVEAKNATCTEAGNNAYWECIVCHDFFSEDEEGTKEIEKDSWIIPATGQKCVSGIPLASMKARGKTSLTISWKSVNGAAGYDIFFSKCKSKDKKNPKKVVKTVKAGKTCTWTKKGLKKNTAYKACVKAYVIENGKKTYVGTSPSMHAFTGGGTKKYTNAKSVTVNKTKVTLSKGKTFKIKAKVKKLKKNKKLMPTSHAPKLRYQSTDKKVATVSSKGKIKAKGKGTCYVYVFAHNGVSKKIRVTVK